MAHDQRRVPTPAAAVHAMHITAADATGLDVDQDFLVSDFRDIHLFINKLIVLFQYERFHIYDLLVPATIREVIFQTLRICGRLVICTVEEKPLSPPLQYLDEIIRIADLAALGSNLQTVEDRIV